MSIPNWLTQLLIEAGLYEELAEITANMSTWDRFLFYVSLYGFLILSAYFTLSFLFSRIRSYIKERPARKLAKKLIREQEAMAERYLETYQQMLKVSKKQQDRGEHP